MLLYHKFVTNVQKKIVGALLTGKWENDRFASILFYEIPHKPQTVFLSRSPLGLFFLQKPFYFER